MNETTPYEKPRDLVKDYTHKEIRETLENTVKFLSLSALLLWASYHAVNVPARVILGVVSGLCFFPGAGMKAICLVTNPVINKQLRKETRFYILFELLFFAILCFGFAAMVRTSFL
jgi:hypothetical protein